MAQVTVLSLLGLPTGPKRTFSAKTLELPVGAFRAGLSVTSAFVCTLIALPVFSGTLIVSPAFTAELRVTNVST